MRKQVVFDRHTIDFIDSEYVVNGSSVSKAEVKGNLDAYLVKGSGGFTAIVEHAMWDCGESDVRCKQIALASNPGSVEERLLKQLEHGSLRLGIYRHSRGFLWQEFRQARYKVDSANYWSNLFIATSDQIISGAGKIQVLNLLTHLGAEEIVTKTALLVSPDSTRNRLSVTYKEEDVHLPLAAFLVPRILPLCDLYSTDCVRVACEILLLHVVAEPLQPICITSPKRYFSL